MEILALVIAIGLLVAVVLGLRWLGRRGEEAVDALDGVDAQQSTEALAKLNEMRSNHISGL